MFSLPGNTSIPLDNIYSDPTGVLIMQPQSNLVAYHNGAAIWASNAAPNFSYPQPGSAQPTSCSSGQCTAVMQSDGNLVLYNQGHPYWASYTGGNAGARLVMYPTTPVMEVVNSSNVPVWTSLAQAASTVQVLNQQINASKNQLLDYFISDVCVDGFDHPVAGDPYNCGNHRNIRIGEKTPYLVTDFDRSNNNATYEAMSSYPVPGTDGALKIVASKNLQQNFNAGFQFNFSVTRDGYDLIDTSSSAYISFIRTSDGGCYDQLFSHDGNFSDFADRAAGWILFPLGLSSNSNVDMLTYGEPISPNHPASCQPANSSGITYWNTATNYEFETGKVLSAIHTYHFASSNLKATNNALEEYYFTKEYGFTRWEAWEPQSRCYTDHGSTNPICHPDQPGYPLAGRCSVLNVSTTGYPGLDTWGGQNWVRTDCRDETNYIAINTPQILVDGVMAQNDGVVDINASLMFGLW